MKYYRIQEKYNERNDDLNVTYTSVCGHIFKGMDSGG